MRLKIIYGALSVLLFLCVSTVSISAEEASMAFKFELTIDGKETKEVEPGDIITVVLKLHRTDLEEPYMMYAMQDEIRYDSTFFELVEDSTVLNTGIMTTDIAMVDQYREFYMNYLSMSGGTQWNASMLIGSIQLRVIGEAGISRITSQDYLVSLQNGNGSYLCDANELKIILSTDCTIVFETNGGSEIPDLSVKYGEKIILSENPVREGFTFEGWYTDIHLSETWDCEKDMVESNMILYAKWCETDATDTSSGRSVTIYKNVWWIMLIILLSIILIYLKNKRDNSEKNN